MKNPDKLNDYAVDLADPAAPASVKAEAVKVLAAVGYTPAQIDHLRHGRYAGDPENPVPGR